MRAEHTPVFKLLGEAILRLLPHRVDTFHWQGWNRLSHANFTPIRIYSVHISTLATTCLLAK